MERCVIAYAPGTSFTSSGYPDNDTELNTISAFGIDNYYVYIASEVCGSIGGTLSPGSLSLVGKNTCSLCTTTPPYPGAPSPPAILNVDAYNQLVTNPSSLDYPLSSPGTGIGSFSNSPLNFMQTDGLVEIKYCFECQTGPIFGGPGLDTELELGLDTEVGTDPSPTEPLEPDPIGVIIDPSDIFCPPLSQLQITIDGIVQGISSERCCTRQVVGQDVTWNGRNCIVDLKNPCQNLDLAISTEGVVLGNGIPVREECCTRAIVGSDVLWDGKQCVVNFTPVEETPVIPEITLNETPITVEECNTVTVSAWIKFNRPLTICQNGEIISQIRPPVSEDIDEEKCCYDTSKPINIQLEIDNTNIDVTQVAIFDSENDGFGEWAGLTITLNNTQNQTFNVKARFLEGLVDCCDYDIYFDDLRVDCFKETLRIFSFQEKCPGFDLVRVIDNKKSWVYNPGIVGYTNNEVDTIELSEGEEGLIQGHGIINRTFAPSSDADIEWRYTDYWEQSNIREKHSKLVLNSKEMVLTYNMCANCCALGEERQEIVEFDLKDNEEVGNPGNPGFDLDSFPLTAYTYDYDFEVYEEDGVTLISSLSTSNQLFSEFITSLTNWISTDTPLGGIIQFVQDDGVSVFSVKSTEIGKSYKYRVQITEEGDGEVFGTVIQTALCQPNERISLLKLEEYKKVFQSFWVKLIEQFVPATTIFVSGERWCDKDENICPEILECDWDYEFVESDVTFIPIETDGSDIPQPSDDGNSGDVTEEITGDASSNPDTTGPVDTTDDGPIDLPGITIVPTEDDGLTDPIKEPPPPTTLYNERNKYINKLGPSLRETVFE